MTSDFIILKEMLTQNMIIPLEENSYGRKQVTLREDNQVNYSLVISNLPDDVLVLNIDKFEINDLKAVFQNCGDNSKESEESKGGKESKRVCARADFAIIAATETRKLIILIEMKRSNNSLEYEVIAQLRGAQCFIEYCKSIGRVFWEESDFLSEYKYYFVQIKNVSSKKKPTRSKSNPDQLHDRAENMLKISNPRRITLNHLISLSSDK